MSRTPEARKIDVRNDGALVCAEKMPRGKCKKLLVTTDGMVRCPNGHTVPIWEAWSEYLASGTTDPLAICRLWPHWKAMKAALKTVTSPEFLTARFDDPKSNWQDEEPYHGWLLSRAEVFDRKAAAVLKDYWEKRLRERYPLLGQHLDHVRTQEGLVGYHRLRQRILRSYCHWHWLMRTPEQWLAQAETFSEAAECVGDSRAAFYAWNVKEAGRSVSDERFTPVYYDGGIGDIKDFVLVADPHRTSDVWNGGGVSFQFRTDGIIKWQIREVGGHEGHSDSPLTRALHLRLERRDKKRGDLKGVGFYPESVMKIVVTRDGRWTGETIADPSGILAIMDELRHEIGQLDRVLEDEAA